MKKRTSSLPLLVVVAVVALVIGSFGPAVAAGPITKAKVKSIATKVVNKAAPNLTVKAAGTATNAANAANLGGLPATAYQNRGVASAGTGIPTVALPAATPTEIRAAVSLTLPPGVNFVAVNASAEFQSASTDTAMWYAVDTTCATFGGFGYDRRMQGGSAANGAGSSLAVLQPLAAGSTHTFRLCGYANAATTVSSPQLLVQTVAVNGTGGTTKPAQPSGSTGSPIN